MMDRVDTATLAFKLAGIYVLVEGVKLVPVASIYLRNVVGAEGVTARDLVIIGAPLLVALIVLVLIAFALLRWSRVFAARALGEPSQLHIDFSGEARDLQTVAFSIVGLVLLTSAVPDLVSDVSAAIHNREQLTPWLRSQAPDLIVLFLQLTGGYWLFLAPRSVRRAWEWLAGRIGDERPPSVPPSSQP